MVNHATHWSARVVSDQYYQQTDAYLENWFLTNCKGGYHPIVSLNSSQGGCESYLAIHNNDDAMLFKLSFT